MTEMTEIPKVTPENRQAVFDYVVGKLAEQGGPAIEEGRCRYLREDGRRCAAGWLLPRSEPWMLTENISAMQACGTYPWVGEAIGADQRFIRQLQIAHDNADSLETAQYLFRRVATMYVLDAACVDHVTRWSRV